MIKKRVPLAGIIQDQKEIDAVSKVLNSQWHTEGKYAKLLEQELAAYFGTKYACVVNSGSSANLLATQCLNLKPNDRVIASACSFPASLNPIIHLGLRPVMVDYNLQTLNIDLDDIERHLKIYDVKAILAAHTLGSPLDMDILMNMCKKYDVRLIEDCCESVGTKFKGRCIGGFGDVGTISFYPSHQINGMGMGGAVLTNDKQIYEQAKSLKSWGKMNIRIGEQYTEFSTTVDEIPYDVQYTYTTIGHNMRMPDANCAYTREQLKKLPAFIDKRRENYTYLYNLLADVPQLMSPIQAPGSEPAYFGYPLVCAIPNMRDKLVEHLENNNINTRLFFSGNILRHKPYHDLQYDSLNDEFPVADYLMHHAFFCGCWPGLTLNDMEYIADTIKAFFP